MKKLIILSLLFGLVSCWAPTSKKDIHSAGTPENSSTLTRTLRDALGRPHVVATFKDSTGIVVYALDLDAYTY